MTDLITEYADYDAFARDWHAHTLVDRDVTLATARERDLINERDTRGLWRLLGHIDEESVFVQIPKWLAEEKATDPGDNPPTRFVGRITRETDAAVLFKELSPARRLVGIAHTIHSMEQGLENTDSDSSRHEQLTERLEEHRERFAERDGVRSLTNEWLPKSQLTTIVRRTG